MTSQYRLPAHLFATGGHLYDTRDPNWAELPPLRSNYDTAHREIHNAAELKATLRAGPYMWPGGYQRFLITEDGGTLSFEAVRAELRNELIGQSLPRGYGRVVGCEVNWEDNTLTCDHTGELIPAAYGDAE